MAKIEILKVRDLTFTMYDSGAVDVTRGKAMVLHVKASEVGDMAAAFAIAADAAGKYAQQAAARAEAEVARIQAEAQRQIDALLASVAPQKAAR